MELEGVKRCFRYLQDKLDIKTFISDRHRGVAKWLREDPETSVNHFYDIWHVARTVVKKLEKAGKKKHCENIKEWITAIRNHIYWCATSTQEGFGELIVAKWKSFMNHIQDTHENHEDNSFPKCAHGRLEQKRPWIKNGNFFCLLSKLQHTSQKQQQNFC